VDAYDRTSASEPAGGKEAPGMGSTA
jgi:hypothetical protein